MKRLAVMLLALASLPLGGRVFPQFGIETFLGGRYRLFSLAPWGGFRLSLAPTSSLIVKFRQQSIAFDIEGEDEVTRRFKSNLSMFTGVYYLQRRGLDAYAALFQMLGSNGYNATGADIGLAYKLFGGVAAEAGLYLLNEKSNLWYPDEPLRRITLYIGHVGVKVALLRRLELQPQVHLGSNSESVGTFAYSASVNFSPRDPIYITVTYMRYSENDEYRYSGDYFSGGINFYF
ncbi:MAG: hypothetical protein JXO51_06710 [Candidatus Aminicenantes bacterium]|nr:hypothetical protein [Candidatus Aminicenantes bacterium]